MQTTDFSPGHFFGFVLPGNFRRELSWCVSVPVCAKNYILETKKQFLFETCLRSSLTEFFFYNIVLGMHTLREKKSENFAAPPSSAGPQPARAMVRMKSVHGPQPENALPHLSMAPMQ